MSDPIQSIEAAKAGTPIPDDATTPAGVVVPQTAIEQQLKGQLRIGLAALAGMMIGKHILPAGIVNDQLLDIVSAAVLAGAASVWSWVRAKINHAKLASIAADPRVPDEVAVLAKP